MPKIQILLMLEFRENFVAYFEIEVILKYVAMGGTALTSWLLAQGADASNAELIVTGLTTAITGTLEVAFSKLASTVAAE